MNFIMMISMSGEPSDYDSETGPSNKSQYSVWDKRIGLLTVTITNPRKQRTNVFERNCISAM